MKMTIGIRAYVNARFAKYLPQLAELGNAGFRRKVMEGAVTKFEISVASAATHYNHALKMTRIADPKSVEGLGRPEGKKGGRKPIHTVDVIKVRTSKVRSKPKRRGMVKGRSRSWKKAVVELAPGQTIELFEGAAVEG
jgi:hypothetical protein